MHELGVVHADLKTENILLRGAGSFKKSWRRLFGPPAASARGAASASGDDDDTVPVEISYHLPASFEVAHRLPTFFMGRGRAKWVDGEKVMRGRTGCWYF